MNGVRMFNVAEFLRLRNESCNIEGIDFEIMSLTNEQEETLKSYDSHAEMLGFAAEYGLAVAGKRVIDDEYMAARLDALWEDKALEIDEDPCIKLRVGEKVCEISGLADFISDKLTKELEFIDGDAKTPDFETTSLGDVSQEQLDDDAQAAALVA